MFKFNTIGMAKSFSDRCTKSMFIILGDDKLYWVVTMSKANKLINAGYELYN